jgi:hypothetical protein
MKPPLAPSHHLAVGTAVDELVQARIVPPHREVDNLRDTGRTEDHGVPGR